MTDKTKREWDMIISRQVYIYGAANTAETLYHFILEQGYKSVKGFLVTEIKDNPEQFLGLPVEDIHNFTNREAYILVPHMGVYKEQISDLLRALGFKNVYFVGQLMTRTKLEERGFFEADKAAEENTKNVHIQNQILDILKEGTPDFGGVMPYQSLELIGLKGVRSTEHRIQEYGLREVLRVDDDVLDIGCNSGFFDISIANLVHSVTGIEYDHNLVRIAELVKNYLKISNCDFYNMDFNDWYKDVTATYNVIFSFAIHHWLNIAPRKYVAILNRLLRKDGYICFESHIFGKDPEFDECYEEFQRLGYRTISIKNINDNGLQERQYILLQKVND